MNTKHGMVKALCMAVAWMMTITQAMPVMAVGATAPAQNPTSTAAPSGNIFDFKIPSSWGMVRDMYNSGTDRLVINIQDAHCDYEAQQNIVKILDRLAALHSIKLVALEGASGEVRNPALEKYPNKEASRITADFFMREGQLTGAEYLALNSDYGLKLFGVEDPALYQENLNAFRQSQSFRSDAQKYFSALKQHLDAFKPLVYNDALKSFDSLKQDYASHKVSFSQYAAALYELAEKNKLNRGNYPLFSQLRHAIKLESKIDFPKVDKERAQLITALTESLNDRADLAELVDKSVAYKKGLLSAGAYANFLKELTQKARLNFGPYPQFALYVDYITLYEQVASEKLFREISRIEKDLAGAMYTTDAQNRLDTHYAYLEILNKLVTLEMLSDDISYFQTNRDAMKMGQFMRFIETESAAHGLITKLPANLSSVDGYLPIWAKFYDLVKQRDSVLIDNTVAQMKAADQKVVALVTGGFHSENISQLLRDRKISYLVITPRASAEDTTLYLGIMQGNASPLAQFVSALQSTLSQEVNGAGEEKQHAAVLPLVEIVKEAATSGGTLTEIKAKVVAGIDGLKLAGQISVNVAETDNGSIRVDLTTKGQKQETISFLHDPVTKTNVAGSPATIAALSKRTQAGGTEVAAAGTGVPATAAESLGDSIAKLPEATQKEVVSLVMSDIDNLTSASPIVKTKALANLEANLAKLAGAGVSKEDIAGIISGLQPGATSARQVIASNPVVGTSLAMVAQELGVTAADDATADDATKAKIEALKTAIIDTLIGSDNKKDNSVGVAAAALGVTPTALTESIGKNLPIAATSEDNVGGRAVEILKAKVTAPESKILELKKVVGLQRTDPGQVEAAAQKLGITPADVADAVTQAAEAETPFVKNVAQTVFKDLNQGDVVPTEKQAAVLAKIEGAVAKIMNMDRGTGNAAEKQGDIVKQLQKDVTEIIGPDNAKAVPVQKLNYGALQGAFGSEKRSNTAVARDVVTLAGAGQASVDMPEIENAVAEFKANPTFEGLKSATGRINAALLAAGAKEITPGMMQSAIQKSRSTPVVGQIAESVMSKMKLSAEEKPAVRAEVEKAVAKFMAAPAGQRQEIVRELNTSLGAKLPNAGQLIQEESDALIQSAAGILVGMVNVPTEKRAKVQEQAVKVLAAVIGNAPDAAIAIADLATAAGTTVKSIETRIPQALARAQKADTVFSVIVASKPELAGKRQQGITAGDKTMNPLPNTVGEATDIPVTPAEMNAAIKKVEETDTTPGGVLLSNLKVAPEIRYSADVQAKAQAAIAAPDSDATIKDLAAATGIDSNIIKAEIPQAVSQSTMTDTTPAQILLSAVKGAEMPELVATAEAMKGGASVRPEVGAALKQAGVDTANIPQANAEAAVKKTPGIDALATIVAAKLGLSEVPGQLKPAIAAVANGVSGAEEIVAKSAASVSTGSKKVSTDELKKAIHSAVTETEVAKSAPAAQSGGLRSFASANMKSALKGQNWGAIQFSLRSLAGGAEHGVRANMGDVERMEKRPAALDSLVSGLKNSGFPLDSITLEIGEGVARTDDPVTLLSAPSGVIARVTPLSKEVTARREDLEIDVKDQPRLPASGAGLIDLSGANNEIKAQVAKLDAVLALREDPAKRQRNPGAVVVLASTMYDLKSTALDNEGNVQLDKIAVLKSENLAELKKQGIPVIIVNNLPQVEAGVDIDLHSALRNDGYDLDNFIILSGTQAGDLGLDTGGINFDAGKPSHVVEYVKTTMGSNARIQFIALDSPANRTELAAVESEDVNVRYVSPLSADDRATGKGIDLNHELKGAVAWLFAGNLSTAERKMWGGQVKEELSKAGITLNDQDLNVLVNGTVGMSRTTNLGQERTVYAKASRFA